MALIGENSNTNRAIAHLFERVFAGCHSRKFALAAKNEIQEHHVVVSRVHRLMLELSISIPAALLCQKTPLAAKCYNVTRRISVFQMMQQSKEIKEHIEAINHVEVHVHLLTIEEIKEVKELHTRLTALDSVTKIPQDNATSLLDERNMFKRLIQKYSRLCRRLYASPSIIETPVLKTAISKIHVGKAFLNRTKQRTVHYLHVNTSKLDCENLNPASKRLFLEKNYLKKQQWNEALGCQSI